MLDPVFILSTLILELYKIFKLKLTINSSIVLFLKAIAGLLADGRHIVETARKEAINYRQQFNSPIPLETLNDRISSYIHAYTLYSAVRPFGVSVILAACTPARGPEMYMIEPSGSSYVSA